MADFSLNPAIELVDNTQLLDRINLQRSKPRIIPISPANSLLVRQ